MIIALYTDETDGMKIASFNVNSLRVRLSIVTQWLEENQPDVLAVQETKVQDVDFPTAAFDEIGYKYAFKGQKSYNGVALFSRGEILDVKTGFEDEPKDEARLITGRVGGVTVVNTYIPQGYL
ncbi:MAG: exodeoxyribonuclease III, partial [Planctomycetota bacterium]